jgi:hypothetical protein
VYLIETLAQLVSETDKSFQLCAVVFLNGINFPIIKVTSLRFVGNDSVSDGAPQFVVP